LTKEILVQYCDLREEAKDIRRRIDKLNSELQKIEDERYVTDSVTGGSGGIQHFMIQGFPYPEYSRKKTRLYLNKAQLETAEQELLELTGSVEEYIQSIPDSRIRRILRHRFIDNMTWVQVSINMGGKSTEESVRKEFERFFNTEEVCP
jgi:hypothetical protein